MGQITDKLPDKDAGRRSRLDTDPVYLRQLIKLYPKLTNKELAKRLGGSERNVRRHVAELKRRQAQAAEVGAA